MAFISLSILSSLVLLAVPGIAMLSGFPYHMQSFNPNSNIDDGTNFGTGNCWTAASNSNGAAVTLQKCQKFGTASQAWTFTAEASIGNGIDIGPIRIFGDKCLDVTDGVNQSGTKLQIYGCSTANRNQQWQVPTGDTGIQIIQWANSTRCVDLTGGNQSPGTHLQIWSCISGNTHQEWISQYAAPTPISEGSTIRLISSLQPGASRELCVIAADGVNNSAIELAFCDEDQEGMDWVWKGGSLRAFENTVCLDVKDGVNANGTPLQVYKCFDGNKNQQWQFNQNYSLQWVGTNKCVDLTGGNLQSGTRLQIWTCSNGNSHQEWEIVDVST